MLNKPTESTSHTLENRKTDTSRDPNRMMAALREGSGAQEEEAGGPGGSRS